MIRILTILLLAALAVSAGVPFRCTGCERDQGGKIKRSRKAVNAFKKVNKAPDWCRLKGERCVVDHIIPLACAMDIEGAQHRLLDTGGNMQWQRRADAVAKDRWEKQLCGVTVAERQRIAHEHGQRLPAYLAGVGARQ